MAQRIVPEGGWGSRLKPERTPRVKDRGHLDFVKGLSCICCLVQGRVIPADDPMHLRSGSEMHGKEPEGGGRTASDRWTVPGCRHHHDQQHAMGSERNFWAMFGIDPFLLALVLWSVSGNDFAAINVLKAHAAVRGYR